MFKNKLSLLFTGLIGVSLGGCLAGDPELDATDFVVGGTEAAPGEFPWQAELVTGQGGHHCGGALIAPQWVLTANHCIRGGLSVVLGERDRNVNEGSEQRRAITDVVRPPPAANAHGDVALLRLDAPVEITDRVVPIALSPGGAGPGVNTVVSGWGRTSAGGGKPNVLLKATLPVIDSGACGQSLNAKIQDDEICAGFTSGRSACNGDSGGPLAARKRNGDWDLVGIVSWGDGCASYSVFGRVSYYRDWIQSVIGK